jgi:hypothetical protein
VLLLVIPTVFLFWGGPLFRQAPAVRNADYLAILGRDDPDCATM